jgi:hypothetical protein
MGKDLDQLIEAVADATTGEFERLKEFGIKAKSEGDNVSFTFRGVTTTVGKNAAEIEKFLIDLGQNNFAGAMAEQMGTLNGIISNAKDAIASFFLTVAEMGPLEEFKLLIADIRDAAGGDSKGLAKILADTLTTAIRGIRRLMQGDFLGTLESIASAFKFLVENVDKLIALFAGAKMVQAFASMASGFTTMGIAAAGALGPIGLIMGALVAMIPVAIDLGNKLGDVISKKSALRTTTKRGGPGFLGDRFATEARAKEAGAQEAIIRKAQSKIEEIESGAYISPNEQVEISKAKQKIRNARSKISTMEKEDASEIALRRELAAQAEDPELAGCHNPQAPPRRRRTSQVQGQDQTEIRHDVGGGVGRRPGAASIHGRVHALDQGDRTHRSGGYHEQQFLF